MVPQTLDEWTLDSLKALLRTKAIEVVVLPATNCSLDEKFGGGYFSESAFPSIFSLWSRIADPRVDNFVINTRYGSGAWPGGSPNRTFLAPNFSI